jgi:hypothetical protein
MIAVPSQSTCAAYHSFCSRPWKVWIRWSGLRGLVERGIAFQVVMEAHPCPRGAASALPRPRCPAVTTAVDPLMAVMVTSSSALIVSAVGTPRRPAPRRRDRGLAGISGDLSVGANGARERIGCSGSPRTSSRRVRTIGRPSGRAAPRALRRVGSVRSRSTRCVRRWRSAAGETTIRQC